MSKIEKSQQDNPPMEEKRKHFRVIEGCKRKSLEEIHTEKNSETASDEETNRPELFNVRVDEKAIKRGATDYYKKVVEYHKGDTADVHKTVLEGIDEIIANARQAHRDFSILAQIAENYYPFLYKDLKDLRLTMTSLSGRFNEHKAFMPHGEKELINAISKAYEIKKQMDVVLSEARERLNRKAAEFYEPLLKRAKSDIRMFLIEHINRNETQPEEAQSFLREKLDIDYDVKYVFERENSDAGTACLDLKIIKINLAWIRLSEDGGIDELDVLDTMVHEIIHVLSNEYNENNEYGIRGEEIFSELKKDPDDINPNFSINELITVLISGSIVEKYYKNKNLGNLKIKASNESFNDRPWAYEYMVEPYLELKKKHGEKKINELERLLTDALLRPKKEDLVNFFNDNQELYSDLAVIIDKYDYFDKTEVA